LRIEMVADRFVGEELGDGQIESQGNFGKRVERGNGVSVFNAGEVSAQQAGLLFDVALR